MDSLYTSKIKSPKVLPLDTEDPEIVEQDRSVLIQKTVSMLTEDPTVILT